MSKEAPPLTPDEEAAMRELEAFLLPRVQEAQEGRFSTQDFDGIIAEAKAERAARLKAKPPC